MLTAGIHLFCYTRARLGAIVPPDESVEVRNARIERKEKRIVRPGSNFVSTTRSNKDELTGIRWRVSLFLHLSDISG